MKPITVWGKFNAKNKKWDHNHIEYGHVAGNKPTGTPEQTKIWEGGTWMPEHRHLDDRQRVV